VKILVPTGVNQGTLQTSYVCNVRGAQLQLALVPNDPTNGIYWTVVSGP
jgi:hypothetical protein